MNVEFSFHTRKQSIQRFKDEVFDVLIIGGGITGSATARDAASRGLSVALVEKNDFAFGTSSRSSKLIHGGLRYLENMEFGLVFEALSERAFLLKSAPHMVKPLKFYFPVYDRDRNGKGILSLGLWLYDLLALFRTPEFHRNLSKKKMICEIPFLNPKGLKGGFSYYDASMWDDAMVLETLRATHQESPLFAAANYMEATKPIWEQSQWVGYHLRDCLTGEELSVRARKVIVCGGPWTDLIGAQLDSHWSNWLNPSKGVHLVFDLKKLPIPGAMVMSHPEDGRIAFVIPRVDFGPGVVIVGTTDSESPKDPAKVEVTTQDIQYLMDLLNRYFPDLKLKASDILSAYVGVRPLVGGKATSLQKVSREHFMDWGPGGTLIVAGGKYTTHRKMAEEIVDFLIHGWRKEEEFVRDIYPRLKKKSETSKPINPKVLPYAVREAKVFAKEKGMQVPDSLWEHYGVDALEIYYLNQEFGSLIEDPNGFPFLAAQLRFAIRQEMVIHLKDFYFRRVPLFLSRADSGIPWVDSLAEIWAQEMGVEKSQARAEAEDLKAEIQRASAWKKDLNGN